MQAVSFPPRRSYSTSAVRDAIPRTAFLERVLFRPTDTTAQFHFSLFETSTEFAYIFQVTERRAVCVFYSFIYTFYLNVPRDPYYFFQAHGLTHTEDALFGFYAVLSKPGNAKQNLGENCRSRENFGVYLPPQDESSGRGASRHWR